MPYISMKEQEAIDSGLPDFIEHEGQLNYLITKCCLIYLESIASTKEVRYPDYNTVIGALECAKQEMYRRMVVPYEEVKKHDNGDIYRPTRDFLSKNAEPSTE